MRKFLKSNSEKDMDGDISQYDFGMVLKETMLNLGPTFVKGQECDLILSLNFKTLFPVLILLLAVSLLILACPYFSVNFMLGILFFFCSHKITNMLVTCVCLLMQLVSPFLQGQISLVLTFPRFDERNFSSCFTQYFSLNEVKYLWRPKLLIGRYWQK